MQTPRTQMLELAGTDFNAVIRTMLHEIKVNTWNKCKDRSSKQREGNYKKNQMDVVELKYTVLEILKNHLMGRMEMTEKRAGDFKNILLEIIKSEEKKKKIVWKINRASGTCGTLSFHWRTRMKETGAESNWRNSGWNFPNFLENLHFQIWKLRKFQTV